MPKLEPVGAGMGDLLVSDRDGGRRMDDLTYRRLTS
jgi:hypothetical protein